MDSWVIRKGRGRCDETTAKDDKPPKNKTEATTTTEKAGTEEWVPNKRARKEPPTETATAPDAAGSRSGGVRAPEGLMVVPGFCKEDEQERLMLLCEEVPWSRDITRLTQHYGFKYLYKERALERAPPITEWLDGIVSRLHGEFGFSTRPDQVIVNRYAKGQGISAHIDHVQLFGPLIATLSLGTSTDLVFKHRRSARTYALTVHPGTMVLMSGEGRYGWTHELKNHSDAVRISITFRTTTDRPLPKGLE